MSFFSDPEHIWIAVLVGSGVTLLASVLFASVVYFIVRPSLQDFLLEIRRRDEAFQRSADLREESRDGVQREFRRSLDSLSMRMDRRDKRDQGTSQALGAIHQRIRRLEGKA